MTTREIERTYIDIIYTACDGKEFHNMQACEDYEDDLRRAEEQNTNAIANTFNERLHGYWMNTPSYDSDTSLELTVLKDEADFELLRDYMSISEGCNIEGLRTPKKYPCYYATLYNGFGDVYSVDFLALLNSVNDMKDCLIQYMGRYPLT